MKDRASTYPGRVMLTPVAGTTDTFDLVRADIPTEVGTPLNKSTLLQDSTAVLAGLGVDATPDDVLKIILNKLSGVENAINNLNVSVSRVNTLITYGTTDLTPGTSPLDTGTLYVVYK